MAPTLLIRDTCTCRYQRRSFSSDPVRGTCTRRQLCNTASVIRHVTPTPTDFNAARSRVIENVAFAPLIEHIAPPPAVICAVSTVTSRNHAQIFTQERFQQCIVEQIVDGLDVGADMGTMYDDLGQHTTPDTSTPMDIGQVKGTREKERKARKERKGERQRQ